ncbi:MAG: hypothetical protein RBG13Loki_3054 [Promethearchaeota archaeon CR_4]|nr:MAG: hypothetical protein RBG13Loki_3054 [Candidatus Lokiarchaeota archaeon CR_4]
MRLTRKKEKRSEEMVEEENADFVDREKIRIQAERRRECMKAVYYPIWGLGASQLVNTCGEIHEKVSER